MPEQWTNERVEATRGLYCRVLMANHDLFEAREYLGELARATNDSTRRTAIKSALLTAFVVSYGRCFTESKWGQDRKAVLLPASATKRFDADERRVHTRLVSLRMAEFAHSDVTAADITVSVAGSTTLIPTARVMRHYSLDQTDIVLAEKLVHKLIAYVTDELIRLQAELAPHGEFHVPRPPEAA